MGYVSTGPFPTKGAGDEFSRRQHRGTGARNRALGNQRLARLGEKVAAEFLTARGATVLGRNVRVGRGEVDLLVRFGTHRVAVEVKTRAGAEPREAFSQEKANRVWEAARRLGVSRVDLIGVRIDAAGAEVRWLPQVD